MGGEAVLDYGEEPLLGGDDAVGGCGDPAERGRPHPRPPGPRLRRRRLRRGRGRRRRRGGRGPSHLLGCHPGRRRDGGAAHATRGTRRHARFPLTLPETFPPPRAAGLESESALVGSVLVRPPSVPIVG